MKVSNLLLLLQTKTTDRDQDNMTGIISHIVTVHIHKLIFILHVHIRFQKTTKNTKATFIFKPLKRSYLQKPLQFASIISGGKLRNSANFYLHQIKQEARQHVFASLFTCTLLLLRALLQPPILYKWGGVRGNMGRMKHWNRKKYIILKSLEKSIDK